jgi:hypothetical protein
MEPSGRNRWQPVAARPRHTAAAAPNTDGQTRLPQRRPRRPDLSTEPEVTTSAEIGSARFRAQANGRQSSAHRGPDEAESAGRLRQLAEMPATE